MKLAARKRIYSFHKNDTIAVMVPERKSGGEGLKLPAELSFIGAQCDLSFLRGKQGESVFYPLRDHPGVVIGGLGKEEEVTVETIRNCAAAITAECLRRSISTLHVVLPELSRPAEETLLSAAAEGFLLSDYGFTRYKTRKDNGEASFEKIVIYTDLGSAGTLLNETEIICRNTALCRDLVNESSDNSTPESIAAEAKKIGRIKGVTCSVLGEKEIARLKMGLLLAVSRGSSNPPRFVILRYRGDAKSKKNVAIIGKGITFDSGGLNLKSSGNIEGMRGDMAGAAACLYAIKAAAELRLERNITAVIPLAENMLGSRSYKPGDIYRAYNGRTVEIGNTDAEGRLILADALSYTADRIKPDFMIDIATLTGACIICFGEIVAGYLTSDERLSDWLFRSGENTGERLWRLPLYREYNDDIKSDIADMNNVAPGRKAGAIIGAVFLKNFAGKTPWAHIDIAGTSWFSKKRGYRPKYATGYGVRLFMEFFRNLSY